MLTRYCTSNYLRLQLFVCRRVFRQSIYVLVCSKIHLDRTASFSRPAGYLTAGVLKKLFILNNYEYNLYL